MFNSEQSRAGTERRSLAVERAIHAVELLKSFDVSAKIIGSLASGSFQRNSDIDFLITECPRALKYRIESIVEDALDGFAFDVVYLDEVPQSRLERFTRDAIDASHLR
jgi:predicted nucleotidyltransferase